MNEEDLKVHKLSKDAMVTGLPYSHVEVEQVDVVPTLSLLLGLPVPQNNLGVMIRQVLMQSWSSTQHRLQVLHINAQQLAKVFTHNLHKYETGKPCSALTTVLGPTHQCPAASQGLHPQFAQV